MLWRMILPLASTYALLSTSGALGAITLNEIRTDQSGLDTDEYFELAGTPGESLQDVWYIVIGDGLGASGTIEFVLDLTGSAINGRGLFFACEESHSLVATADLVTNLRFENSDNVTHLLVTGFTGADGDDLDLDDDCVLDVTPWISELDRIALIEEENPPLATDCHYGPPTVGPNDGFVPAHIYRCPSGSWFIGPFTYPGDDTPGASNASCGEPIPTSFAVSDVPGDQGGWVLASWVASSADDPAEPNPVEDYTVERFEGSWGVLDSVPADHSPTYSIAVGTPDILTMEEPAPFSSYRVVAHAASPSIDYTSSIVQAYSIDNVAPRVFVAVLYENPLALVLGASLSDVASDLEEVCWYRGTEPGFTPSEPVSCGTSSFFADQTGIRLYFVARASDIHGNRGDYSNEVSRLDPTAIARSADPPLWLTASPNPSNPTTVLEFHLPRSQHVRLGIYDLAGRLVARLANEVREAGSHRLRWGGRDRHGRATSSGTYVARLETEDAVRSIRVTLLR
jgi:hypothetical protein